VTDGVDDTGLLASVLRLRSEVDSAALPLDLPDAGQVRSARAALLAQLDDYVIPRLTSLDAPLLAVVGGSTGAGKSTLVNSVVGSIVSRSGVLRPTTRSPVLVHHPDDASWFAGDRVLPSLARLTGRADAADQSSLRLTASRSLPPGLAMLDAPDIDSVVQANRDLAKQLLAAADLWLFVTTAARYADAVPWDLLREASARGSSVAVVLDRVPPEAMDEIRTHLEQMLRDEGLGDAPLFTVVESALGQDGRLPDDVVAPLRSWLSALASDAKARAVVVRRTLTGALDSLRDRVAALEEASDDQVAATGALRKEAAAAYAQALADVEHGITDGTLLRGEVLARWQEFVGTGEFLRTVEVGISRLRDRITAAIKGTPPPADNLGEALQTGVAALLTAHGQGAAAATARAWRQLAGGPTLLQVHPDLAKTSPGLVPDVDRLVREWQGEVLSMVRDEGKDRRTTARVLAFGVNGIGAVLMLVAFSQTGGLVGAEIGVAGGAALLAQRLLEAVFGDQAVRDLAAKARKRLLSRASELYAGEQARFDEVVDALGIRPGQSEQLRAAAAAVQEAR
jgi:energy-coupling factor transporter ATP-binding protein EcfA2